MDSACYNVNIILYRSLHGVRPPNLRKLFLLKWREAEKLSSPRVRLRIFRAREVEPCLLDIHYSNAAENWNEFEQAWKTCSVAMKLHQEPEIV